MMMNNRKLFLIIISLVTIVCIISGSVYHINKARNYFYNNFIEENDTYIYDKKDNIDSFDSIKIDGHVMKIYIEEGETFDYDITFNHEKLCPEVSIENDTLKIKQREYKGFTRPVNHICDVYITVPSSHILDDVIVESNVGEIDVSGITSSNIELTNNVGEITAKDVTFDSFSANSNVGEIKVTGLTSIRDYNLNLSSNIGKIKVNNESYKGSYNSHSNSNKEIEINTNIGEITVKE